MRRQQGTVPGPKLKQLRGNHENHTDFNQLQDIHEECHTRIDLFGLKKCPVLTCGINMCMMCYYKQTQVSVQNSGPMVLHYAYPWTLTYALNIRVAYF